MTLTATEFKTNFGKYMDMLPSVKEGMTITKNGRPVAVISSPQPSAVEALASLLPASAIRSSLSYSDLKAQALGDKYEINL